MKKFAIKSVAFLGGFLLICWLIADLTDRGLKKSNDSHFVVWNNIYDSSINADMLLCGGSRAYMHFSPRVFDSVLGLNTYNLGMEGWGIIMQLKRLQIYLQHNRKPKYIVQNIDFATFFDRSNLFDYEQFLPYLSDSLILNACKTYTGAFSIPEIYFPLFKYNNQYRLVREGFAEYINFKHKKGELYKGYIGKDLSWDGSFEKYLAKMSSTRTNNNATTACVPDSRCLLFFNLFMHYCHENKITVFLVFSPTFQEALKIDPCTESSQNLFRSIANKYGVAYFDYSTDTLCNDRRWFYNSNHLNLNGSKLFSARLADTLKGYIANYAYSGARITK